MNEAVLALWRKFRMTGAVVQKTSQISKRDDDRAELQLERLCCNACRDLALQIERAIEWYGSRGPRSIPPQYESATVLPGSLCRLCNFLGSTSRMKSGGVGRNKVDLNIQLLAYKSNTTPGWEDHGYVFQPCIFDVFIRPSYATGKSAVYEVRKIVPVARERMDAYPTPPYRPLRPDLVDFKMFRSWFTYCEQHHGSSCSTAASHFTTLNLPDKSGFRFIDCQAGRIVPGSFDVPYVALSYVWGAAAQDDLMMETQHLNSVCCTWPQTIQDAMTVTMGMGFQYLWVDRYCINQHDRAELHRQLFSMNSIYHLAVLTIIAAAGTDSNYGLPGVRANSRLPQPRLTLANKTWVSVLAEPSDAVKNSKWNTRGWTYQEGYFSRKCLIFSEEQVIWQCNAISCSELADPNPVLAPRLRGFYDEKSQLPWQKGPQWTEGLGRDLFSNYLPSVARPDHRWLVLDRLEEYSTRELTDQSDVLNAVRGILTTLPTENASTSPNAPTVGVPYHFWGIPLHLGAYFVGVDANEFTGHPWFSEVHADALLSTAFGLGLCWRGVAASNSVSLLSRRRHGFPSWSWAGWIIPVTWPSYTDRGDGSFMGHISVYTNAGRREPLTRSILEYLFRTKTPESSLYTSRINISTTILDIKIHCCPSLRIGFAIIAKPKKPIGVDKKSRLQLDLLVWPVSITPDVKEGSELHTAICTQTFKCVVVCAQYGLIVRTKNNVSERLGVVDLRTDSCIAEERFWGSRSDDTDLILIPDGMFRSDLHLDNFFPAQQGEILLE